MNSLPVEIVYCVYGAQIDLLTTVCAGCHNCLDGDVNILSAVCRWIT